MTKHYQAHADREAKEKYLAQMPDFIGRSELKVIADPDEEERMRLIRQFQQLSGEKLPLVTEFFKNALSRSRKIVRPSLFSQTSI